MANAMEDKRKLNIIWTSVIFFSLLHIMAVYALYLVFFEVYVYGLLGGLGVTAGAHRLWTHRSYKAKLPLRVMLMLFHCIAIQNTVLDWARNHRMHHKYSETDADPHNAKRGFFFSHMGWLMVRKHPDIKAKGHTIDISDLTSDPVLQFQKKYYGVLVLLMSVVVPMYIATLWGETLWNSFFIDVIYRFTISLHHTWLVNSAAHMWGNKPYDKHINPAENKLVAICAFGEGFHNYHHAYPWDYKTSELGNYSLNVSTLFIDVMAKIGWAYDLKTVPHEIIKQRIERSGDGSHVKFN
ncbi:acyl-CoA Delta-9 desaturase-like isoform X2 [Pectinophora gossypiella]|uniref:acyl-CoA Delta-9 desaturase-like isoform X2 n=1 Tax=Pectinophora gossypiella TaxID=13191 RepID=UPI00214EF894|nr:acyl-CoA Delta-9 desaturase-like isoform X2 [Pectinophora gossypiella]